MVSIQPISRDRHKDKRWQRFTSYEFARGDAIAPLVGAEVVKAMHTCPIGFILDGEQFIPVAVLALQAGRNLFIAPDGKWVGGYIPAALRGYPFRIGQTESGEKLLCIDEDSGLITDGPEGEAFFDEAGGLSEETGKIMDFLGQTHQNRAATLKVCTLLAEYNLIVPWEITVRTAEGDKPLGGLYRVDEPALNELDTEAFEVVRRAGALPLIYSQLFSMQHMTLLGKLADAHANRAALMAKATPKVPELTQSVTDSDTIDWSRFGM